MWSLLFFGCSGEPVVRPSVEALRPADLRVRLEGAEDKPRIYNFWATWCAPCLRELPGIVSWSRQHPNVRLILVNVDVPADRERKVVPLLKRNQWTDIAVVQLDDPDPAGVLPTVVTNWPDSIPVTLVVAADGTRIRQFNGEIRDAQLDGVLERLPGGGPDGIP
jgi:thiol-disulfide isomerase/thioredoxin